MKAWAQSERRAGTPSSGRVRAAAGWLRLVVAVSLACAGCSGGERASAPDTGSGETVRSVARPEVVCQPPPAGANALLAAAYAICAEYRAGRIDRATYAAALAGTGAMVISIVALEALEAQSRASPVTATVRSQVVQTLQRNATMAVICRAPSLAVYGGLPACAVLAGSPAAGDARAVMTAKR